jgi:hypothetical protein
MSRWLDTTGLTSIAVAVCDRCKMKRPIVEMSSDPNEPGVFVCGDTSEGCLDEFDPWRLPAREPEDITLQHPRPDLYIGAQAVVPGTPQWPFEVETSYVPSSSTFPVG